jgi:tetratricopeptide (TPR) repeat protein
VARDAAASADGNGDLRQVARARVTEAISAGYLLGQAELAQIAERAVAACRAAGDAAGELATRSAVALGYWGSGELGTFVALQKEIATEARRLADASRQNVTQNWIAVAEFFRGEIEAAEAAVTEAVALAERHGLREGRNRAEQTLGHFDLLRGDLDAAEAHYRRMLAEAEEVGSGGAVLIACRFLAYVAQYRGDAEAMARHLDRAIAVSESTGDRWSRSELFGLRARAALLAGDVDLADAYIARCFEFLRQWDVTATTEAYEHLGAIRAAQGRFEDAEAAYRRAIDAIAGTEFNWPISLSLLAYAEFLARRGRHDDARAIVEERAAWLHARGWHLFDEVIERTRALIAPA